MKQSFIGIEFDPKFRRIRHPKQRQYLRALATCFNVSEACRMVGIHRSTPNDWKVNNPDFLEALEQIRKFKCDQIEAAIYERAVRGRDVPIYQRGLLVGHRRDVSDLLLIFAAKAEMPDKYRDAVSINGEVRMPVSFSHERDPDDPSLTAKPVIGRIVQQANETIQVLPPANPSVRSSPKDRVSVGRNPTPDPEK